VRPARDAERRAHELEALEHEARAQEATALVRWGIAQVANDGYRAVLELTFIEKLDGGEIAERLGITTDNVYQRRRRGLKELERILRARRP
jgi:DNA-directed RNA polymerase specialized sigma24 family protein